MTETLQCLIWFVFGDGFSDSFRLLCFENDYEVIFINLQHALTHLICQVDIYQGQKLEIKKW